MTSVVQVYIYDISQGMAGRFSQAILGRHLEGIWHTGLVVYDMEHFYGSHGISAVNPGSLGIGPPQEIVDIGRTEIPYELFQEYLIELEKSTFSGCKYHVLEHNCNNFSNEIAQFLTGNSIPEKIVNLPADFLTTPLGQMIRPFIDSLMNRVNDLPSINREDASSGDRNTETELD